MNMDIVYGLVSVGAVMLVGIPAAYVYCRRQPYDELNETRVSDDMRDVEDPPSSSSKSKKSKKKRRKSTAHKKSSSATQGEQSASSRKALETLDMEDEPAQTPVERPKSMRGNRSTSPPRSTRSTRSGRDTAQPETAAGHRKTPSGGAVTATPDEAAGARATPMSFTDSDTGPSRPVLTTDGSVSESSVDDEKLLGTFVHVMQGGITLTKYNARGTSKVMCVLEAARRLVYRAHGAWARRKFVDLDDVLSVERGKNTAVLQSEIAASADEANCFSLIMNNKTLDFEADSPLERDALVQGFDLLIAELKSNAAVAAFGDSVL